MVPGRARARHNAKASALFVGILLIVPLGRRLSMNGARRRPGGLGSMEVRPELTSQDVLFR
jgi:hypothetical protein